MRPILSVLLMQEFFLSLLRRAYSAEAAAKAGSGCEGRARSLNCVRDGEPVEPFCPHKEYRTCFQHATFAAALRCLYRRVHTAKSEDRGQKTAIRRPSSVLRPLSSVLCPPSSVLRPPSSVLRPPSSVARSLCSRRSPSTLLRACPEPPEGTVSVAKKYSG